MIKFLADNIIALGWMSHASRSRRDTIKNIARAYAALLIFTAPSTISVVTNHIPGIGNVAADDLFRPIQLPTWSSVDLVNPKLKPLTAYKIPADLLLQLL